MPDRMRALVLAVDAAYRRAFADVLGLGVGEVLTLADLGRQGAVPVSLLAARLGMSVLAGTRSSTGCSRGAWRCAVPPDRSTQPAVDLTPPRSPRRRDHGPALPGGRPPPSRTSRSSTSASWPRCSTSSPQPSATVPATSTTCVRRLLREDSAEPACPDPDEGAPRASVRPRRPGALRERPAGEIIMARVAGPRRPARGLRPRTAPDGAGSRAPGPASCARTGRSRNPGRPRRRVPVRGEPTTRRSASAAAWRRMPAGRCAWRSWTSTRLRPGPGDPAQHRPGGAAPLPPASASEARRAGRSGGHRCVPDVPHFPGPDHPEGAPRARWASEGGPAHGLDGLRESS